ncbi:MAG: DMT family transporter [Candidatus Ornithomonoglobus sp.]
MKKTAIGSIMLAGILWGAIGIFIRTLEHDGLSSLQVVFMRVFFGSVILLAVQAVRNPQSLRLKLKDIWCFLGSGIAGFAFFNYCYFTNMEYASLSLAAILLYTAPSIVIILSALLFREKIQLKKIIALILAFGGCMCATGVFRGDTALSVPALFLGLGSGLGYALVTIFTRYALNRGYPSTVIVIYTLLFASFAAVLLTDVRPVFTYMFSDAGNLGFCLLFVTVSTIMPNLLYTFGLSRVENGIGTIVVSLEPIAASVVGAVVYAEPLGLDGAVGIILISISLIILNLRYDFFLRHSDDTAGESPHKNA